MGKFRTPRLARTHLAFLDIKIKLLPATVSLWLERNARDELHCARCSYIFDT